MAETATEKKVCPKCGVEVRPNTLFCYNCGSAVVDPNSFPTVKDALLEEEMAQRLTADKRPPRDAKLTSAASLRQKKDAAASNKTVEVVWEEPDSAPNPWFLAVALLLTIFAVGAFVVMIYIR